MLLNRAPTLHRLGIQAFKPVLIEDMAIRIPPLVCAAFNADFDGDQMAVHLPLTAEAQVEAATLMDAGGNLLKPANGEPIVSPTQDMVLGIYFLTHIREGMRGEGKIFSDINEAAMAYEQGAIDLNARVKAGTKEGIIETSYGRLIFNGIMSPDFDFVNEDLDKKKLSNLVGRIIENYTIEESRNYIDKIKDYGFKYATVSSVSWGIGDTITPVEKEAIIAAE